MSSHEPTREILLDHNYDGIQEYDNPLPGWWVWLFIATTVFAVFYVIYFHMGAEGRTIHDDYDRQSAQIFEMRFKEIGELEPNLATMIEYMKEENQKWLAVGRVVYKTNCVSCHGPNGEGLVGPNLTDDNWKNVKKLDDIITVIQEGAANGAMPAWRNRLSHVNQVVLTAAYVASLRGTGSGGKAPEGDLIPPWPTEQTPAEQTPAESN